MTWPFAPLPMFGFDVIVIDPPTDFELYSEAGNEKSASAQYDVMSWPALEAMPFGHLARANAIVLLWACPPTLEKSFALLKAMGARYKTELVWRKLTKNGKPRMATGYRARAFHESVLVGVLGNERQIHKPLMSLFDGVEDPRDGIMFDGIAREHSRKPESFYEMVTRCTPGLDRADLFARQSREGWSTWGNQATKFDGVAA